MQLVGKQGYDGDNKLTGHGTASCIAVLVIRAARRWHLVIMIGGSSKKTLE